MAMKIIRDSVSISELWEMAKEEFGDVVKAVIDVEQGIMAIGGELHADEEVLLTEEVNSKREHTWGINLRLEKFGSGEFIEFDSMVNIKPAYGNRSRGVENLEIQKKIQNIVNKIVSK